MNVRNICTACKIKIGSNKHLKDSTVCKTCDKVKKKTKNNNNTLIINQQLKIDNVNSNNNNRTLIIGFANRGETYVMNHILLQRHEPIFIITKSANQYLNIKAQTSDEIQPLENYENGTVVFDDMLLSKQESNIDLFFARGQPKNIDIYYISQSYFHLVKITIRNNSDKFF